MITIKEGLELFLADLPRNLRPNSITAYRSDLTLAAAFFLTRPLDQFQQSDLLTFLTQPRLAPATINRRTSSLSRFFQWAVSRQFCSANPLAHFEPISPIRKLPRPVRTQTELDLIEGGIATASQPYRLIFTILRETGMRVGEVLALTPGDVTLAAGREGLLVRDPKNRYERLVILGPDATPKTLRGLKAWLRLIEKKGSSSHNPLFVSNRGTRLSYSAVQYQWSLLCQKIKLVEPDGNLRYTLHQLRHTRGSELVRQGVRMEVVQRVLGHRDIRSTQGYAELDDLQVREILARNSARP